MMFTVHTTNYCGFTPVAFFLLLLRGWKPTLDICDDTRCRHRQSDVAPELVFFWQVIGKCPFGRDSQVSPEVDVLVSGDVLFASPGLIGFFWPNYSIGVLYVKGFAIGKYREYFRGLSVLLIHCLAYHGMSSDDRPNVWI